MKKIYISDEGKKIYQYKNNLKAYFVSNRKTNEIVSLKIGVYNTDSVSLTLKDYSGLKIKKTVQ